MSNWDTSKVVMMNWMFANSRAFNGYISKWNTKNDTTMEVMFCGARVFNEDISKWNTEKVTTMAYMFASADAFRCDIGDWNVTSVLNMTNMFNVDPSVIVCGDLYKWQIHKNCKIDIRLAKYIKECKGTHRLFRLIRQIIIIKKAVRRWKEIFYKIDGDFVELTTKLDRWV